MYPLVAGTHKPYSIAVRASNPSEMHMAKVKEDGSASIFTSGVEKSMGGQ
jgi:hypothetical protein